MLSLMSLYLGVDALLLPPLLFFTADALLAFLCHAIPFPLAFPGGRSAQVHD